MALEKYNFWQGFVQIQTDADQAENKLHGNGARKDHFRTTFKANS